MNKLIVNQKKDCWICFNNENNITITTVNSEKLIRICGIYLGTSINVPSFDNESGISCCCDCYEYSNQITLLNEEIKMLQKEITNLSLLFSKNVLERRNRLKYEKKSESANKSATPKDTTLCVDILENSDCHSEHFKVTTENVIVEKEDLESVSKGTPLKPQEKTEIKDCSTDKCFDAENSIKGGIKNVILPEDEIELKYSYDEAPSKVLCNFSEVNERISELNPQSDQEIFKTTVPDSLNCLKNPFVRLERLQISKSKSVQQTAVHNASCNLESELKDPDISITESSEQPEENTVMIKKSVVAGGKNRKPKKNLKEDKISSHCQSGEGEKPFNCTFCSKCFTSSANLYMHRTIHTGERPFNCSFCSKSFRLKSNLKMHERLHTGDRPFKCSFCSQSFYNSFKLKIHGRSHTGERPYNCSFCSKSFRVFQTCKRHEKLHSGERPYKCSICPKLFTTAIIAKNHQFTHTTEKPLKCLFCEKSFLYKDKLKTHEMIHTGERPFNCSRCLKPFRSLQVLKPHQKECQEKPYEWCQCSICYKPFKSVADLDKHKIVHSIDTPYKCSFCPKSFRHPSGVKIHEKSHEEEKPHKCSICEKAFKHKFILTRHELKHGENTEEYILP